MLKLSCKFLYLPVFWTAFSIFVVSETTAKDITFTTEDRDRLIRLEVKIEEMNARFDQRFEQIDKRFEEVNLKINMLASIFTAMFLGTLGFAFWDRRTMVRPFETKVKEIDKVITLEKEERIKLTESLKELARTDVKLQGILQKFNIL